MQLSHMPRVNGRYWLAITLASLFGTNLGDLYAHDSGLGLLGGLPILAVLAGAVFLIERRDHAPRELYYWLLIIVIRTGATNIADYFKKLIAWPLFGLILTVLLAGFAWWSIRDTSEAEHVAEEKRGMPQTGGAYWSAMLSAGVFGTFFGDVAQHLIGRWQASLVLGALLLGGLAIWRSRGASRFWLYWVVVAIARTAGTAMGDFLAESDMVNIGLPIATLITGTAFVLVLICWRQPRAQPVPLQA
jgi:uncharacterized membrane-anchored protein